MNASPPTSPPTDPGRAEPDASRDHAHGRALVWWKHEQSAWCPFCLQGYAWELHVACSGCDRTSCPLCIDHQHADGPRCPECATEEASA